MDMDKEFSYIVTQLRDDGYAHLHNIHKGQLREILNAIGEIIQITDVKVNPESRALVTSSRGLDFHTDHHKADIIAWHCIKQSSEGGESIFVDGEKVIKQFTTNEKKILSEIQLREHKIFSDDRDSQPLLQKIGNKYRFYYSFWLVNKDLRGNQKEVLEKFKSSVAEEIPYKISLQPKDVLLIDNGRILHGRADIRGDKDRFLKRFWISNPEFLN